MKALIVDDERLARNELRRMLALYADIEIAGEARDAADAATLLGQLDPDVLFLDIQMPGGSGFDLLASLDSIPLVIFTTAYDEYALQAFEVSALDYLLKPIVQERLAAAIAKLRGKLAVAAAPSARKQIFVKDGERCWFVNVDDILLLESEGNYTRLYFGAHKPLIFRSLNYLEERLDPARFFRASRRHMLNLQFIASIDPWMNGGFRATLKGGHLVEMSRRQAQKFKELMSL